MAESSAPLLQQPNMEALPPRLRALLTPRVNVGFKPILKTIFVVVAVVMLIITADEKPNVPIRVWICVYAVQNLVKMVSVFIEWRRQRRCTVDLEATLSGTGLYEISTQPSFAKRCEQVNTIAECVWWIVGIYWVVYGWVLLQQNAPRLCWLTVFYLAFDISYAILCGLLVCIVGGVMLCCAPCIVALWTIFVGEEENTIQESNNDEKLIVEDDVTMDANNQN